MIYAARVRLAKMSLEEALEDRRVEWEAVRAWVDSRAEKPGSLLWFCDMFDHDVSAVRRAIREKRK
jgi:hypothetical protein